MKLATVLAAALAAAAAATLAAQAGGVVFNAPVTYTEPVTYAAGVTYLARVTYAQADTQMQATATPVMLERVIVTPTRTYAEHEWRTHLASKKASPQYWPVKQERHTETSARSLLRVLLQLQ